MSRTLIQHILLVAAREFRQIAATRSFWLTLLIFPLSLAVPLLIQRFSPPETVQRVMLIDPAGTEAPALRAQIALNYQRAVLTALARYAQRHGLEKTSPSAPWAHSDRVYGDAEVQAFMRSGGEKAALATMAKAITPDMPAFTAPKPRFELVPTPPEIAAAAPEGIGRLIRARIEPPRGSGEKKLHSALFIPAAFGKTNAPVRLWTADTPDRELVQTVQTVLTRDLRLRFLESAGLAPEAARAAGSLAPIIAIDAPPPGGGRERVVIRSVLPLLMSFMLLMSLIFSGAWMLQGLVEEKSNKLLESMLACVSPNALMYGKLIGTVATGLLMVVVWIACAIGAAYATQGVIADFLRPALASLSSAGVIAAIIYYFIAGYLMVSMIYLAIGAVCDSGRDAQSYMMPITLGITLPFSLSAGAVLNDNVTTGLMVTTWVPIWTPFTMLARLGSGVPLWELLGAGAMLAAFIVVEFILLGRVFRASLLSAGQKPSLARLAQLMRVREIG